MPTSTETKFSAELVELLTLSGRIRSTYRSGKLVPSCNSTMFAFFVAKDDFSNAFQKYVRNDEKCNMKGWIKEKGADLKRGVSLQIPVDLDEQSEELEWMLRQALRFTSSMERGKNGKEILIRDLMAAFIYDLEPSEESVETPTLRIRSSFAKHGLDREQLSAYFLDTVEVGRDAESFQWLDFHKKTFGTDPFEVALDFGDGRASAHIASDMWTTADQLQYNLYAKAIASFIQHEHTTGPLTISIQAPWGGGKTSLMRMIQKHLDEPASKPAADRSVDEVNEEDVKSAVKEIVKKDGKTVLPTAKPQFSNVEGTKRLTVWFNAWKYQTAEQAYAGLADAVIEQISARMCPKDRALFWLKLNSQRLNKEMLVQDLSKTVGKIAVNAVTMNLGSFVVGLVRDQLGPLVGLAEFLARKKKNDASGQTSSNSDGNTPKQISPTKDGETAGTIVDKYLTKPTYRSHVGMFHHIEIDLRRALEAVPKQLCPIVVFIDDLDRCKQESIVGILEAVNLFLAGEFPECRFILGMDSELVAAALQDAHASILKCVDSKSRVPLGWKYMDKFVQLSFVVPPPSNASAVEYARSLFSHRKHNNENKSASDQIDEIKSPHIATAKTEQAKEMLDAVQIQLQKKKEQEDKVDSYIKEAYYALDDSESVLVNTVVECAGSFSNNPREIKRFINVFRFYYYLRGASMATEGSVPSVEQILGWAQMTTKWSQATRWVLKGAPDYSATHIEQSSPSAGRLRMLENAASKSRTHADWTNELKLYGEDSLDFVTQSWLADRDFFNFIQDRAQSQRGKLSDGAGLGLW